MDAITNWMWIVLMCFLVALNFAFLVYIPIGWISLLYLFGIGFYSHAAYLFAKFEITRQQWSQSIKHKN